ncbi:MAG: DUF4982 domain-containing protein [Lachnospiraceae bacterium]|nr:DUF4982 domain-containing protein [Lachnospiraceae bacterium]
MNKVFNDSWKFLKTDIRATYQEVSGLLASFSEVKIPHDWLIGDSKNLYETSAGWYYKEFTVNEKAAHTFLRFDGVYMDSEVYVNDVKVGEWKYGYSTFCFEITEQLVEGTNKVMVHVRHEAPNSRWYSGAGIFRDVHYIEKDAFYLPEDGSYVNITPLGNGDFQLDIEIEAYLPFLEDERPKKVQMIKPACTLISDTGRKILLGEAEYAGVVEDIFAERFETAKKKVEFEELEGYREPDFHEEYKNRGLYKLSATVHQPDIWDIENPRLYTLFTGLFYVGTDQSSPEILDSISYKVGFKTIQYDLNNGLILNGKNIKLNGVCEHHDLGALGAAFNKDAMKRKFRILKKMGVNALRTSHNMPDPKVMELCDEMGILVDNEAFDMWEMTITTYDYARFFPQWSSRDVASWIRRDRNHVSNIMWSIGNEIPDTVNGDKGVPITKHLVANLLIHDPYGTSKPTIGSNFMEWEKARNCTAVMGVAGYNYAERLYRKQHEEHPDWIIYGSETSSMVTSRGVYHFPIEESIMADEDGQCSSIGNSTTSWGARNVESCVYLDRDIEFSLGQFLWSGFDYIGEPTPYSYKNSYFGQIDTAGFPKDQYYCFMAEWTTEEENPFVHLYPYWNWNEGQLIDVRACSTGKAIELFLNGKSLGRKYINHEQGKELVPTWKVPYEKGELLAIAYDETGKEIAKDRHVTFGDSYRPIVFVEHHAQYRVLKSDDTYSAKIAIEPDGRQLYFVDISMADINGNIVENAMDYCCVKVENGSLVGTDNGDSTDYDSFKADTRKLFNGKLMAMIEPNGTDTVLVTVTRITSERVPVRQLEIVSEKPLCFTADDNERIVRINVYPENATDKDVTLKVVNSAAIELDSAKIEKISGNEYRITAEGDCKGYLRATSKSGTDMVRIISQLELSVEGMGEKNICPYKFVSAGLNSKIIGDVGSGNDKGVCFAPHGESGVVFNNVDFGTGTDELELTLFTFSDAEYEVRLYDGDMSDEKAELIQTLVYKQPCDWNVYKLQKFKLAKRLKGIMTISFAVEAMFHMKGFEFTKQEKAYSRLQAVDYDHILGDSFKVTDTSVKEIGNNVCLTFNNMNFGEKGASRIQIEGSTPLEEMTIRLQFTPNNGQPFIQSFSVKGGVKTHQCSIEKLTGEGKVEFIFLPGTQFDFDAFCFE